MIWKKSIGYKQKEPAEIKNRFKLYRQRNTVNFIQKNANSVGSANTSFHIVKDE